MAVGDIITAVRYNNIQSTVEDVLGVGSANFGYGGSTASNQVPVEKIVAAGPNKAVMGINPVKNIKDNTKTFILTNFLIIRII